MEFVLMFVDMAPTRPFLIFMEAKNLVFHYIRI